MLRLTKSPLCTAYSLWEISMRENETPPPDDLVFDQSETLCTLFKSICDIEDFSAIDVESSILCLRVFTTAMTRLCTLRDCSYWGLALLSRCLCFYLILLFVEFEEGVNMSWVFIFHYCNIFFCCVYTRSWGFICPSRRHSRKDRANRFSIVVDDFSRSE